MRYIKLASNTNPFTDFIELNNLNGLFCTSVQNFGMKRNLSFFEIKNRRQAVGNEPSFKRYSLRIDILTSYGQYESEYQRLADFLDRNKRGGVRFYYQAEPSKKLVYTICDIEEFVKTDKRLPINLILQQNSLWLSEVQQVTTSAQEQVGNLFSFTKKNGLDCVAFRADGGPYSITFVNDIRTKATITNRSYENIPLVIQIRGLCINPVVTISKDGVPIKTIKVLRTISLKEYVEINSNVFDSHVAMVNTETGEKSDLSSYVDYSYGSPFAFLGNGSYEISTTDDGKNRCETTILWQEEYNYETVNG